LHGFKNNVLNHIHCFNKFCLPICCCWYTKYNFCANIYPVISLHSPINCERHFVYLYILYICIFVSIFSWDDHPVCEQKHFILGDLYSLDFYLIEVAETSWTRCVSVKSSILALLFPVVWLGGIYLWIRDNKWIWRIQCNAFCWISWTDSQSYPIWSTLCPYLRSGISDAGVFQTFLLSGFWLDSSEWLTQNGKGSVMEWMLVSS
jgi:hypothetical protein